MRIHQGGLLLVQPQQQQFPSLGTTSIEAFGSIRHKRHADPSGHLSRPITSDTNLSLFISLHLSSPYFLLYPVSSETTGSLPLGQLAAQRPSTSAATCKASTKLPSKKLTVAPEVAPESTPWRRRNPPCLCLVSPVDSAKASHQTQTRPIGHMFTVIPLYSYTYICL